MKKYITILLVFIFTFLLAVPSFAANIDINSEVAQTKLYYRENFKNELFDWQQTIIFAATNILTNDIKLAIPELTETNKDDASTYAKIILTYAAIGRDPRTYSENIDYVDTLVSMQKEDGSFGDIYTTAFSIYALEAARAEYQSQKAIDFILSKKFADGGYAYEGATESDIDTTAMILTVFSEFKLDSKVNNSIKEIITFLKSKQQETAVLLFGVMIIQTLLPVLLWGFGMLAKTLKVKNGIICSHLFFALKTLMAHTDTPKTALKKLMIIQHCSVLWRLKHIGTVLLCIKPLQITVLLMRG